MSSRGQAHRTTAAFGWVIAIDVLDHISVDQVLHVAFRRRHGNAEYFGYLLGAELFLIANERQNNEMSDFNLALENQIRLSEVTLREARRRYINGSSDFVNVLKEELNFLQLQQDTIKAREQMIAARIHLHKALGGTWLDELSFK